MKEEKENIGKILLIFLQLGFTSFGGPIAHLGYFREAFVERRKWLSEKGFADLIALCQFLPGPASSQVGIGIGLTRGGIFGSLAAWIGFTLPSALAMIIFGYGVINFKQVIPIGVLHGLKIVAVAVVGQAIWGMSRTLCPDKLRITIAVISASIILIFQTALVQFGVIILGAFSGFFFLNLETKFEKSSFQIQVSKSLAIFCLFSFFLFLFGLPVLTKMYFSESLALFDSFYRSGSLVFGGGHVVLPLLKTEVVPTGLVSKEAFMAGYGAAQAVPGPLFTFSAFLGTVMKSSPNGWMGAFICLFAIFLPSFFLMLGVLPFWDSLGKVKFIAKGLLGVNASVVGLLLAAFYNPLWISAVLSSTDFILALLAFLLLVIWRVSPYLVVCLSALGGWVVQFLIS
ncbi:MAG: chromate efflux transporter [Nitrospinota bacterium]|nr:chromate efflux transporter [Nitrospinota bacterium]